MSFISTSTDRSSTATISSRDRLSALESLEWYHPTTSRHVAETLLLKNGAEGSFLLRDRSDGIQGQEFVLSVRSKDAVSHYEARWNGKNYVFGFGTFSSLTEFQEHLLTQTLLAGENGVLTVLKNPYPRDVIEPSSYDTVRIHATIGRLGSRIIPANLSIATKEGYLTKQGGFRKNWKTRWFTVQGSHFKYFKDRQDKDPLRTMNLFEATRCEFDCTHRDRDHCFALAFPWRTFYFCATTHQEAQEWVKLLKWKIETLVSTQERRASSTL